MNNNDKISPAVIRRLPKYYRYLGELTKMGLNKTSSRELSEMTGFSASQIRQDLNNFGGFGQQGFGYDVENLRNEIARILGLDKKYKIIIIGAGNIGQAIANYTGFYEADYEVVALFDKNPKLIGMSMRNALIKDIDELEEFLNVENIDIAVICTPKSVSQQVAEQLVQCGIRAIWNFAPKDLKMPDYVHVENVHLNESLFSLTYYYNQMNKKKSE
ncbi:redox-sensing transcriptional repressor Rex [Sedimentibacter hydroxybenzoicus DSM 7310]|uniref:Redox-sensing transcriptional repressor Rex n=1 Tax=Sedimentibacter hydroxybenzoicus DSM 7310 TaxID=1123245 RepID=A0A974BL11_SEDHY|nr:redox-sensing transcriptional repressor Rex [Sedimentibacter hydroxybenzoicus]NYB74806.1 redox-sensing transcriptional repressor Rex [Sedimentibacter hydroxybenzoicus DSM 7310]